MNKRILTVVFGLNRGGTERSAQNFAIGYKEMGFDSRVLYTKEIGINPLYRKKILNKKGIPVYYLKNTKHKFSLKQWRPDIIHIHSHAVSVTDFSKIKKMYPNAKYVETNVFSHPSNWSDDLNISLQLSNWCEWKYRGYSKKKTKKISILPYPIMCEDYIQTKKERFENNLFIRNKYKIPKDVYVIGRIGQPDDSKWSVWIVDIFETFLLLVSPPSKIIKQIKQSNYRNQVIIIGTIHDDKYLKKIYSSINLFLSIGYQGESFGYVNTEAILTGTPVLTLATPWSDNSQIEIVKNNVCGYVVHRKDTLYKVVQKLILKEIIYNSKLGVKSIKDRFDYRKVCKRFISIVENKHNQNFSNKRIINLMNMSIDKPKFLVIFFLKINMPNLTFYVSGYDKWPNIIYKALKKIFWKF